MESRKNLWLGIPALTVGLLFAPSAFAQVNNDASTNNSYNAAPSSTSSTDASTSTSESTSESTESTTSKVKEGTRNAYHRVKRDVKNAALEARVKKALLEDKRTRHEEIHVAADRGAIMLTGAVDSRATAEHVKEVAARLDGVRHVRNDLTYPSSYSDTDASSPSTAARPYSSTAPAEEAPGH